MVVGHICFEICMVQIISVLFTWQGTKHWSNQSGLKANSTADSGALTSFLAGNLDDTKLAAGILLYHFLRNRNSTLSQAILNVTPC